MTDAEKAAQAAMKADILAGAKKLGFATTLAWVQARHPDCIQGNTWACSGPTQMLYMSQDLAAVGVSVDLAAKLKLGFDTVQAANTAAMNAAASAAGMNKTTLIAAVAVAAFIFWDYQKQNEK